MLALTENATEAIEGLLAGPEVPDGAGLRIMSASPAGDLAAAPVLRVGLVAGPEESDAVIEEAGARVFLQDTVVDLLDDKLLDAAREGDQIRFEITEAP